MFEKNVALTQTENPTDVATAHAILKSAEARYPDAHDQVNEIMRELIPFLQATKNEVKALPLPPDMEEYSMDAADFYDEKLKQAVKNDTVLSTLYLRVDELMKQVVNEQMAQKESRRKNERKEKLAQELAMLEEQFETFNTFGVDTDNVRALMGKVSAEVDSLS
jgi:hypothetical protein